MIYTVTLNPSLDYHMECPALVPGATNRSLGETVVAGGKGINVSFVLAQLGMPTTALGFAGGFTGRELVRRVAAMGVPAEFFPLTEGETRINVKVRSETETEVNGAGPMIEEAAVTALKSRLSALQKGDVLVLSGSLPRGADADLYAKLLSAVPQGVLGVVDTTGKALAACLPLAPFLVKPNADELCALYGEDNTQTQEQALRLARRMQNEGAQNVLVSLGGNGALLLTKEGQTLTLPAARGQVVNTVGAGDSMIAGFLTGLGKENNYARALKLGVACGGATAFRPSLATAEQINRVLQRMQEDAK